jgi:hypothetical protein
MVRIWIGKSYKLITSSLCHNSVVPKKISNLYPLSYNEKLCVKREYLVVISPLKLYILIISMELGALPRYVLQTYPVPVIVMNRCYEDKFNEFT